MASVKSIANSVNAALNQSDAYIKKYYERYKKHIIENSEPQKIWWEGAYVDPSDVKNTFRDKQDKLVQDNNDAISSSVKNIRNSKTPSDNYILGDTEYYSIHNFNARLALKEKTLNGEMTYENPNYKTPKIKDELLFVVMPKKDVSVKYTIYENPSKKAVQDLNDIYKNVSTKNNIGTDLKSINLDKKTKEINIPKNQYENPIFKHNTEDLKDLFNNNKYKIKTPDDEQIIKNPVIKTKSIDLGIIDINIQKPKISPVLNVYEQPKIVSETNKPIALYENPNRKQTNDLGDIFKNNEISKKPADSKTLYTNPDKKKIIDLGNIYDNNINKTKKVNLNEEEKKINQGKNKSRHDIDLGNIYDAPDNITDETDKIKKLELKQSGKK